VFAWAPHKSIEIARSEGYAAHMEPGISAEDCLYADLGIDPGKFGCQHYEASQLLFYERRIDPTAYLVLWQVGLIGDQSLARFSTGPAYRQVLVDVLARDYPLEHEVIIYARRHCRSGGHASSACCCAICRRRRSAWPTPW
jgi:hypothetical protein